MESIVVLNLFWLLFNSGFMRIAMQRVGDCSVKYLSFYDLIEIFIKFI